MKWKKKNNPTTFTSFSKIIPHIDGTVDRCMREFHICIVLKCLHWFLCFNFCAACIQWPNVCTNVQMWKQILLSVCLFLSMMCMWNAMHTIKWKFLLFAVLNVFSIWLSSSCTASNVTKCILFSIMTICSLKKGRRKEWGGANIWESLECGLSYSISFIPVRGVGFLHSTHSMLIYFLLLSVIYSIFPSVYSHSFSLCVYCPVWHSLTGKWTCDFVCKNVCIFAFLYALILSNYKGKQNETCTWANVNWN